MGSRTRSYVRRESEKSVRKPAGKSNTKLSRLDRLAVANLAFVAAIYGLGKWPAELTSLTTFIAYFPTAFWMAPTAVLLLACLFAKKKRWVTWNCIGAATWGLIMMGFSFPTPFSPIEGSKFTLMTFNIRHAETGWDGIRSVIEEKKPYIVCFQEADSSDHFGSAIGKLPGYFVQRRNGLAIASREPLTNIRSVSLAPGTPDALEATAKNGVRVVNLQLASFSVSKVASSRLWALPKHLKSVADVHETQIAKLLAKYSGAPDCVIAGDFNNPPRGRNFEVLNREFDDAFGRKGWGFGYTYPSAFPLLRIDYAFVTDIKPVSAEVVASTRSDHRPVFFELLIYRPT